MHYYEVLAASQSYHGTDTLTYSTDDCLTRGQIVIVPLRKVKALGIVTRESGKPAFATKSIIKTIGSPLPGTTLQLLNWLRLYYPAPLGAITQQFLPSGLLTQSRESSAQTLPEKRQLASPLPPLTSEQKKAVSQIRSGDKKSFLLHGATGTGKTRIYMELAEEAIKKGLSVLVLTPEIGLTPQLVASFQKHFTVPIYLLHSNLTDKERRNTFLKILSDKSPCVVIGPRSALFAPIAKLGLIVVDEAHDSAYKQEQAPYYLALRVAAKLNALHSGSRLVLGTATPLVSEYFQAQTLNQPIIRLTEQAVQSTAAATTEIINLKDRDQFSRHPHLSNRLLELIEQAIRRGEQSLVFLNRRGTARLIMCQLCGWQALCPECDLPLTYHGDSHNMRCHTCGHAAPAITSCPKCSNPEIVFKSIGTKAIADELARAFPHARIKRFDTDNLKADRLEAHYESINKGEVDILVGTQMLTKGLDLPGLAVVGAILADTSLYFPDYTADERTYQLLTQVAGRVGRGHRAGTAIIQTYNPDSLAIKAAQSKDWTKFYEQQLKERQTYDFPPYVHVLKLSCERATQQTARSAAQKLVASLQEAASQTQIIGPAPSFHEKIRGKYRWQIIVKSKRRSDLLKIIPKLPAKWTYDLDPTNLL